MPCQKGKAKAVLPPQCCTPSGAGGARTVGPCGRLGGGLNAEGMQVVACAEARAAEWMRAVWLLSFQARRRLNKAAPPVRRACMFARHGMPGWASVPKRSGQRRAVLYAMHACFYFAM
jgi:hypothetical protein